MTSAEQYRQLVNRLESIMLNEEEFPKLRIGDIDPRNGKKILDALVDGSGYVVRSRYGDIWNVKYGEPDKKEEPPKPAPEPEKKPEPEKVPEPEVQVNPVPTPAEPEVKPLDPLPSPAEPEVKPEVKCGPEVQAEIKKQKTFNAAFALARKSGCDTFDWCQIVRVPGQAPTPKPEPVQGVTTNPMGDFDPTDFSGDFTKPRKQWNRQKGERGSAPGSELPPAAESIDLEEAAFIPGSEEIDRIREIAGTQIVEQNIADIAREQGLMMGKPKDPNTKCSSCGRTWTEHTNPDGTSKVRHPFLYKAESGQAQTPTPTASATPPKKQDATPGTIPEIKASSKEKAIEIARQKGIKVFRFCCKYGTNLAKKKTPKKQDVTPVPKKSNVGPRFFGQPNTNNDPRLQKAIDQGYIDSAGAGGAAG